LAGDVGNAYLNAETKEKIFTKCGLEFGPEMVNRIAIVQKGLYGLKSSGNRWHSHFTKAILQMGFTPSRYDGEGYDYIATYADDFLITAKDAWSYIRHLQSVYTIKEPSHPEIYLGALYTGWPSQDWTISCKNYIKEAITRIECQYGTLREEKTPSFMGDHPEQDDSTILDNEQHSHIRRLFRVWGYWAFGNNQKFFFFRYPFELIFLM